MNATKNTTNAPLHGIELRYVLTIYLFDNGASTILEMIDGLAAYGFRIRGRPSKSISDALRWERRYGRVRRLGHGTYGPGSMPRGTEYRIHDRVLALRKLARADRPDIRSDCRSEAGKTPMVPAWWLAMQPEASGADVA